MGDPLWFMNKLFIENSPITEKGSEKGVTNMSMIYGNQLHMCTEIYTCTYVCFWEKGK